MCLGHYARFSVTPEPELRGGALYVITGLVPVIHVEPPPARGFHAKPVDGDRRRARETTTWVTGTSPVMTEIAGRLASRLGSHDSRDYWE
jgi:hypothetical protein